jgi:uncharacterized damage-inducible protein DinB
MICSLPGFCPWTRLPVKPAKTMEETMKKLYIAALISLAALPLAAQQGGQAQQPPTVAAFVRQLYMGVQRNIVASGNKMPEENFGLRPGPQMEVRTFGQHIAHVANFNFLWCSQAKGEKNPNAGHDLEKELKTKAEFMKAVQDSFAYCDSAYNALTDASGAEVITITQESGAVQQRPRMGLLILNVAHNNEIYGNMVTTMRIKSIVPSSSEPRPPQGAPGR